jgi:hypothetical protein
LGFGEESGPICEFRYIPVSGIFSQAHHEEANAKQGSSEGKQSLEYLFVVALHTSCVEVSFCY